MGRPCSPDKAQRNPGPTFQRSRHPGFRCAPSGLPLRRLRHPLQPLDGFQHLGLPRFGRRALLALFLDDLFRRYGCHSEGQISVQMPGEKGMEDMQALMARFRAQPPDTLGGMKVARVRDYLNLTVGPPGGRPQPLRGPKGDMVILDLAAEGNYVAVRPSGTEPKVKFYTFAYDQPSASQDLPATKAAQAARLKAMGVDLRVFAGV